LLVSAKEFLAEALLNYSRGKRNFAILHAVAAAELVLKERLNRIHPTLIYKNIDEQRLERAKSVGLVDLPRRLANFDIRLEPREVTLVETFGKWRNQIVHHMPQFDEEAADEKLPQLLEFVAAFLRRELDIRFEEFLSGPLFKTASNLMSEWVRAVQEATTRAHEEGNIIGEACPQCGGVGVLCLRGEHDVYCHVCSAKRFRYDECEGCGRQTVGEPATGEGVICQGCIEAAGDQYLQMLDDIARGK